MRAFRPWLLVAFTSCVQVPHRCPSPCGDGQVCDATVGQCKDDPCGGKCHSGQRCKEGTPPHCVNLNVGEVDTTGPRELESPRDPAAPLVPH